jgi:hypothetical protein
MSGPTAQQLTQLRATFGPSVSYDAASNELRLMTFQGGVNDNVIASRRALESALRRGGINLSNDDTNGSVTVQLNSTPRPTPLAPLGTALSLDWSAIQNYQSGTGQNGVTGFLSQVQAARPAIMEVLQEPRAEGNGLSVTDERRPNPATDVNGPNMPDTANNRIAAAMTQAVNQQLKTAGVRLTASSPAGTALAAVAEGLQENAGGPGAPAAAPGMTK